MSVKHDSLIVSAAPHINAAQDTATIMRDVCIALIPALAWSVYIFGVRALFLTIVCAVACVFFEWAVRKVMKRDASTIRDCSAVVTGMILAFNLPSSMPYWMAIVGCFIAIVIVKQLFGGLGQNFANPAIVARISLFVGFASPMANWVITEKMSPAILANAGPDAVTGATPLMMNAGGAELPTMLEMFLGKINGSMGEISSLCLIIGGLYLIVRRVISPAIPLSFIASVALFSVLLGRDPLFDILSGGVMLGAIFMATDYVTSPVTTKGRIIFGIGCGMFTVLIRRFGSYPEGVSFAILLMNIMTPHIDTWTKAKLNGVEKGGAK
jgi:electron transport complex protein RnfD